MLTSTESSRFGWIVGAEAHSRPDYDVPVHETASFVVMPSLGSLTAGWLLVVPTRRMPNLSYLVDSERDELRTLIAAMDERLRVFGGEVFRFEHGGSYGSLTNCGVDQAHLHLVPLAFDLIDAATTQGGVRWRESSDAAYVAPLNVENEYFSAFSPSGRVAIGTPDQPQSQWFRRLIATELGLTRWDYKTAPELGTLKRTLEVIG